MGDQGSQDYFKQNNRAAGTLFGGAGMGEDDTGMTRFGERAAPMGWNPFSEAGTPGTPTTPASSTMARSWMRLMPSMAKLRRVKGER